MYLDVADLRTFYDLPLGRLLRSLIGARVRSLWPSAKGESLLGIGYAGPFLRPYMDEAERCVAAMPAAQGVVHWPRERANASVLVEADQLPFSDSFFQRAIMVHALDMAGDPAALLREAWRVLVPGGKLIVIVPNRRGVWARAETSPFGYGRPFSKSQIQALLQSCQFDVISKEETLYIPPVKSKVILRSARTWETVGRALWPAFAGLLVIEAQKRLYKPAQADGGKRSVLRVLRPVFVPEAGVTPGLNPHRRDKPGPRRR